MYISKIIVKINARVGKSQRGLKLKTNRIKKQNGICGGRFPITLGLDLQFTCTLNWAYPTIGSPKKLLVVSLMVLWRSLNAKLS